MALLGATGDTHEAAGASDQAMLGKAEHGAVGHDEVIEHANVHQRQNLLQGAREGFVGTRRLGRAAGVVVRLLCPVFLCAIED